MPTAFGGNGFPNPARQVANALGAATRAVKAVAHGKPVVVPPAVLAAREAICKTCEENIAGRCRKCGCGVRSQFIRKTQLATEQCPLDPPKWGKWPETP